MVDSVLLLVDAAEGPLPQTRYVLQKAMALRLPVVVAINKIDRSDARPAEVVDAVYELFMDLGADEHQIDFPIVYTNARVGTATLSLDEPGTDLRPLLDLLVEHTPAPTYEPDHPLQMLVTNLAANDYVGRMAVGRIRNGTLRMGSRVSVVRLEEERPDGSIEPGRTVTITGTVTSLTVAQGIERLDIREAGPGEIVWLAGIPEVTIGDTVTDAADPRPLPRLHVDEPTLRMTFGVNTSPLSGREGKFLTSRQIKARLDREVLGNVSIEVAPTAIARYVRGARAGRAPAGGAHRADAPRGLRAPGVAPRGAAARDRRRGPGALRAHHHRHPARVHGHRHRVAGRAQGTHGADDHRRGRPHTGRGRHPHARPGRAIAASS